MRRLLFEGTVSALLCATALGAASIAQGQTFTVSSPADSGPGSLRAALAEAEPTGGTIVITGVERIEIANTLTYAGTEALTLVGNGQSIATARNVTLLQISQGADLSVEGVSFEGPGGFSVLARGDTGADAEPAKGIFVETREDQDGVLSLTLTDVGVSGVAGHGIHLSDCTLPDGCVAAQSDAISGASAAFQVQLNGLIVAGVGHGGFGADGLRVDERGAGYILVRVEQSQFHSVGGHGVALSEGQAGDVMVFATDSAFTANGAYCAPDSLRRFLPPALPDALPQGALAPDALPDPIADSPDDRCFDHQVALHEDGSVLSYQIGLNASGGMAVEEGGVGSILATLSGTQFSDNWSQGLGLREHASGDISVRLEDSRATGNMADGFLISEAADGGIVGVFSRSLAERNGGTGAVFEEEEAGHLMLRLSSSFTNANGDGRDSGLRLSQRGDGTGFAALVITEIEDGIAAQGMEIDGYWPVD